MLNNLLGACAWLVLGAAATESAPPVTVVVMPMEAKTGVAPDLAAQLTALLVTHAGAVPGFRVTSFSEVQGALGMDVVRQLAGCDNTSCAAEVAGALDSDELVFSSLGTVGGQYVLTLSRISARKSRVSARGAHRFKVGDEAAIMDAMPRVVAELFGAAQRAPEVGAPAPAPAPAPAASTAPKEEDVGGPAVLPWILRGVGAGVGGISALAVLGALAAGVVAAGIAGVDLAMTRNPRTHVVPVWAAWMSNVGGVLSVAGGVLGVGLLVVAGALVAGSMLVGG